MCVNKQRDYGLQRYRSAPSPVILDIEFFLGHRGGCKTNLTRFPIASRFQIIRGQANRDEQGILPPLQKYIESAVSRQNALLSIAEERAGGSAARKKKLQLDLS